jgi:hypothetical protein
MTVSVSEEVDERLETDRKVLRLMVGLSFTSFISLAAFLGLWLNGQLTFSPTSNPGNAALTLAVSISLLATPVQFIIIMKAALLLSERPQGVSTGHRLLAPMFCFNLVGFVAGLVIFVIAISDF